MTSSISDPTEGDSITLTCVTSTSGVTSYKFYLNGTDLTSNGNINTYTIPSASLGSGEDGNYTCVAYFESVPSENSTALSLFGRSLDYLLHEDKICYSEIEGVCVIYEKKSIPLINSENLVCQMSLNKYTILNVIYNEYQNKCYIYCTTTYLKLQ